MTLPTESIDIPLLGGLNQAVDKRLVEPGQALDLQNVRSPRQGGWEKRYGTTPLARTKTTSGSISAAKRLGAWQNNLLLSDGSRLYARSATDKWAPVTGALWPCQVTEIAGGLGQQARIKNLDMGRTSDGVISIVFQMETYPGSASYQLYHYAVNEDTGAVVWPLEVVGNTDEFYPRIITVGSTLCLIYGNGSNEIKLRTKTTGPASWGTAATIVGDAALMAGALCEFDACAISGSSAYFALGYWSNGFRVKVAKVDLTGTVASTVTSAFVPGGASTAGSAVAIDADTSTVWVFATTDDGSVSFGTSVNYGTWLENTPTAAFGVGSTDSKIGVFRDSSRSRGTLVINNLGTSGGAPVCYLGAFTTAGALVNSGSIWYFNDGTLLTQPYLSTDTLYVWTAQVPEINSSNQSGLGSAMFLSVDMSVSLPTAPLVAQAAPSSVIGRALCRLLDTGTESLLQCRRFTNPIVTATKHITIAGRTRELAGTKGKPIVAPIFCSADFADTNLHEMVEFAGHTYITPGQFYDGERVAENFFNADQRYTSGAAAAGAGLSTGTYQYVAAHRWVSAQGRIMRLYGFPCDSFTATSPQQGTSTPPTAPYPTQLQDADITSGANRYPGLRHIVAELYRTEANGTIYYLVATDPCYKGEATAFTDTVTDATASAERTLNTALAAPRYPPSLRSLGVWLNRLVGIGPDLSTVWVSSEPADTECPWWNEDFNLRVDGEMLTALAVLDDKLLIFTERAVFVAIGQPADNTGAGNTLTIQNVSSDVGCIEPRSVVSSSIGVWFQAVDGIYLVDRSLQVVPIGRGVQDELASYPVITSATVKDEDREVRFTLQATEAATQGIVLAFDITEQEWIRRTYLDTVASPDTSSVAICSTAVVDGVWYAAVSANGNVLKEISTAWTDDGVYVESRIITPWIKVAGVQGFQRIRRLQWLFERHTACDFKIEVAHDWDDGTWTTPVAWTNLASTDREREHHVARQKTEAIKVKVTDYTPTSGSIGTGRGLTHVALRARAGVKQGQGKLLPAAQKG